MFIVSALMSCYVRLGFEILLNAAETIEHPHFYKNSQTAYDALQSFLESQVHLNTLCEVFDSFSAVGVELTLKWFLI